LQENIRRIPEIRAEFWNNVRIPGSGDNVNMELEKAGRVADFLEFAELMCYDALEREESCGGHFRTEHQYTEADPEVQSGSIATGDAKRNDDQFARVSAWQYNGDGKEPTLHKEPLIFEDVHLSVRSYK
jgi:succinate dehydrogenase / fumarate reductase flavoprotein subunit